MDEVVYSRRDLTRCQSQFTQNSSPFTSKTSLRKGSGISLSSGLAGPTRITSWSQKLLKLAKDESKSDKEFDLFVNGSEKACPWITQALTASSQIVFDCNAPMSKHDDAYRVQGEK
jgi:hypothetical protein